MTEPGELAPRPAGDDALIRLRLGPGDVRYAGDLVPGAKVMEIFGDLETELALREGGDEGLCVAYESVEFTAPLHVGDFVEGHARVVRRGRTSRTIEARLFKVVGVDGRGRLTSTEAVLAASCRVTIVVGTRRDDTPGAAGGG